MSGRTVHITQKAGVDGRLFGSVTNNDIAEALTRIDFKVSKSQVRMPERPAEDGRRAHRHCRAAHRCGGRSQGRGRRRNRLTQPSSGPAPGPSKAGACRPFLATPLEPVCAASRAGHARRGCSRPSSTDFHRAVHRCAAARPYSVPMVAVFTPPPLPNSRSAVDPAQTQRRAATTRSRGCGFRRIRSRPNRACWAACCSTTAPGIAPATCSSTAISTASSTG